MRKLVAVVGVLGVLWTGVELVAPGIVEARIEERAEANTEGTAGIEADIDSFPFVTRLLLSGRVQELQVSMSEVLRERLTFTDVRVVLEGIELDRGALMQQDAELRDIARGTVVARLDYGRLSDVFGAAEQLGFGDFSAEVRGRSVVVLRNGREVFDAALPGDLFPCDPTTELTGEAIELRCTFTDIPDWLVAAANRAI